MSLKTLIDRERELDDIYGLAVRLNSAERRVLLGCAKGLVKGQTKYAEWEASKDDRNLVDEALQESLDMAVYLSMAKERGSK